MELAWWHWMVLGMALIALEMLVSTFFVMWFGMGALLVGLLMLFAAPGFAVQMVLWAILSVAMTLAWLRFFKNPDRTRLGQAKEGVKGVVGLMTKPVTETGVGEIMFQRPVLGADRWPAVADEPIAAGERARIVDVLGQTLKIEKIGG
ncbi:MAG TPA: NfeD family protein [Parasulfuritortus sp.]